MRRLRFRGTTKLGSAGDKFFECVAQAFVRDADMEHLFLDSTILRAHQHSAGAQKKPAARKSVVREGD